MASREKLSAQFLKVVNFAVEGNPNGAVLIAHWLMTGRRQVNDRKPTMDQRDTKVRAPYREYLRACIIRTAMPDGKSAFT
jgi:hypothetical protein